MKFPFNGERKTVVTSRYLCVNIGVDFVRKYRSIYIYSLQDMIFLDRIRKQAAEKGEWISYLDRFFLLLPREYQKKGRFWKDFYRCFGMDYLNFIDVSHNFACISYMLEYIKQHTDMGAAGIVLDYGCGSGISAGIKSQGQIVGYEPVEYMRIQADRNGLKTLGRRQLESLPSCCFDAVFASYVFHMAIDEKSILQVAEKIKPGGLWIANFYKGLNIENMNSFFTKYNFGVKQICDFPERFGTTYEYKRKTGSITK